MITRLARAAVALVLLVGIVAGLPWLLLTLGGPYLIDRVPTLGEVSAAIRGIQDGRLVLGAVVVGGWLAWLYLLASTVLEINDAVRYRSTRPHRGRRHAGRALTGVLVMWLMAGFASQATAAPALAHPATTAAPTWTADEPSLAAGPDYLVRDRDTLWDIAERELGDPLRWREIFDLNVGREQPDGLALTNGSMLRTGWTLTLPVPRTSPNVTVRPGDTLATIAARTLHNPARFPELFDANAGRPQNDGGTLSDPNVIRPGWLLQIPATTQPAPVVPEAGFAQDDGPPSPSGPPPTTVPPPSPTPSVSPTTAPHSSTLSAAPPTTPQASAPPSSGQSEEGSWGALYWGGAGLAAAGVLGAVALMRRRQLRARRHGRQIALPSPRAAQAEVAAVTAARPSDAELLGHALAQLTGLHEHPDLRAAAIGPDGAELTFADPVALPEPFVPADEPTTWSYPATSDVAVEDSAAILYPAVASVGASGERSELIDLEHHRVVRVDGDPDRARDLLRSIVVELGTSRWADATEIVVCGLEPNLARLSYSRVRHLTQQADALVTARARITAVEDALSGAPELDVLQRRSEDPWTDAWVVTVVVIADAVPTDQLAQLAGDLRCGPRRSVALLVSHTAGDLPAYRLHVQPDGTLDGTQGLRAEQMDATYTANLLDIIGTALQPDQPVPPAAAPHSWANEMGADGSWTPDPEPANPWQQTILFEAPAPPAPDDQPQAPAVDPVKERALLKVERDDPDLDAELAEWRTQETPARPHIAILGPPEMRAPGDEPVSRMPWFLEIAVYLALHPRGVSVDKLATDLWPASRPAKDATVRRALVDVRAWAGHSGDDPNEFFLPSGTPGVAIQYRLTRVLLDWDLFRRLRKRANARAAGGRLDDAIGDYRAALDLVRGPVLRSRREHGYGWLRNPDQHLDTIIPSRVIDTAHELVDLALTRGDLDIARQAAEASRVVDPELTYDGPFLDLMRISRAEGNLAEMREHADLLLAERGFEVGEELPKESFEVFHQLFPNGLNGRR